MSSQTKINYFFNNLANHLNCVIQKCRSLHLVSQKINYHKKINIFSALESLHLSEDFADVTLYCDGTSHKAHKVILSACSPYFKSVFMEHPHCTHPVIILKGVTCDDLSSLLTFMYQGEVNIQRERLPEFMRTAKLLQVRGLTNCFDINPVGSKSEDKSKRQLYADDSNTDSDSSSQGVKKRIRIRRKSMTKQNSTTENMNETELSSSGGNIANLNNKSEKNSCGIDKSYTDIIPLKIKQEMCTDATETQSASSDNEGSILQRSLIGDHTVKPAESLVITPDLPLPVNPTVKIEPELNATNHTQLPMISMPAMYTKTLKKFTETKDKLPQPHQPPQPPLDNDNFEDKLSNTLQLLKSNPQISVSREHFEASNKKDKSSCGTKSKLSQYEIQPQISIEPMKQQPQPQHVENNGEKHRLFHSNNSSTSSILAHNLTKHPPPIPPSTSNMKSTVIKNSASKQIESQQTESSQTQSSLSTLVQLFSSQTQPSNIGVAAATAAVGGGTSQSGGLSWNCPHCQQLYHNQSALKYHVRLVHSDFNNRLCCYLCPNSFTMRESYKAHMLELHGIRH